MDYEIILCTKKTVVIFKCEINKQHNSNNGERLRNCSYFEKNRWNYINR